MRKTRIAGLFATVVALVAVLALPAVSGANHRHPTKIRIAKDKPFLHGVLSSRHDSCERDRLVVVKKARPGQNKVVNADSSSFNGGWSADVNRRGTYIVKIDGFGVCGGDKRIVTLR